MSTQRTARSRWSRWSCPPAGSTIDASLTVKSGGGGDVCNLTTSDGLLQELQFTVGDNDGDQLLLQGEFDNTARAAGRVRVSCSADDQLEAEDARIRAMQFESLG